MSKIALGPRPIVYPMPAFLIGTTVDGKPNIMTAAWGGVANGDPPMVSVAIRNERHTFKGIQQNRTFSVNVPSTDIVKETDYCGIASGSKVDKIAICKFDIFYGKLKNVPLIEQCPVNLECIVVNILELGSHNLVIGMIEETHITDSCLTDEKADVDKIKPLIFTPGRLFYYDIGKPLARAFHVGKELKEAA